MMLPVHLFTSRDEDKEKEEEKQPPTPAAIV